MADPQAQALHVDSNTVRTVQAAAMVGMCLAAGYIIAFGAGLVWPRPPDGEGGDRRAALFRKLRRRSRSYAPHAAVVRSPPR